MLEGTQGSNPEQQPQSETRVDTIREQMREFFPEFPDIDTEEYDGYKPEEDEKERGQILKFFTTRGRGPEDPQVWFVYIQKRGGFVINYFNTSQLKENPELGYNGDSVYGPGDKRWKDDQIDIAIAKTRIRYEGIDINDQKLLELVKNSPPITMTNVSMDNVRIEAYRSIFADRRMLPPSSSFEGSPDQDYVNIHPDDQNLPDN